MDFTQKTYRTLLQALQAQGFSFITFEEYIKNRKDNVTETASSSFVTIPDYLQHNTPNPEPATRNPELGTRNAEHRTFTYQNASEGRQNAERLIILRPACTIASAGKHDVDLIPMWVPKDGVALERLQWYNADRHSA